MIEKMLKVYCAAKTADRERLLTALRDLGVVHLVPVAAEKAVPGEALDASLDRYKRALQIAGSIAGGTKAEAGAVEDVDEQVQAIIKIQRSLVEAENKLSALHRQMEGLAIWGDTTVAQLETLQKAGVTPAFYVVPDALLDQVQAECMQAVGKPSKDKTLMALIDRTDDAMLPEGVEEVPLLRTDRPAIRAEAADIDAAIKADRARLAELATSRDAIAAALKALEEKARYNVALGGALDAEGVFAVQGWIPQCGEAGLTEGLSRLDFGVGIQTQPPEADEEPPTLIRYPWWVKPIKGLFDILGTLPGYKEVDLAPFFMVAMPLFAAILIGDAGYGLVFIVLALALGKKAAKAGQGLVMKLLLIMGIVTFLWGMGTGSFFGLGPIDFVKAGGVWEDVGKGFNWFARIGKVDPELIDDALMAGEDQRIARLDALSNEAMTDLRLGLIKVSFVIAVIHLILARIREILALAPDQRSISSAGWAICLAGMFGIIWFLFGMTQNETWLNACFGIVGVGFLIAVLFAYPHPNPLKRVGIGFASSLLPLLGAFSDMMSYIRLMAVSMASVYIGLVFNMLGSQMAGVGTWAAGIPIVLFGHGLNIGLCLIAIFAHGVRLNMLEFSNNVGVQWGGYPFEPFATTKMKEN